MSLLAQIFGLTFLLFAAPTELPLEVIDRYTKLARDNLAMARLADGTSVPEETAEERASPIVPSALDRQTVERGFLSAAMEVCGLNWRDESYLPYMKTIRASKRYSDKQLAYIGFLHGIVQGNLTANAGDAIECSDSGRARWLMMARERKIETP